MKHNETYEDRLCEECGAIMHVAKKSAKRFCSYECQSRWQKKRVGELNPKYNHILYVCDYCGKEYMDRPYKTNASKNHFCGIQCRQDWYSNIWSQSKEWKEESSLRAVKLLKTNPSVNTKPQMIVNNILDSLHIKYENEHAIGHYAIDNYIPDSGLFIEVMGDYWHCNRMKYDAVLYKNQKESIRRDKAKHTYTKKYYGVEILYLWESDVLERRDVVKSLIFEYISNKGILSNYQSMNYDLVDGNLVLRDSVLTYQEMSNEEIKKYYKSAS